MKLHRLATLLIFLTSHFPAFCQLYDPAPMVPAGTNIESAAAIDYNNDGLADIVMNRKESLLIQFGGIYLYTAYTHQGELRYTEQKLSDQLMLKLWVIDVDGDGDDDVISSEKATVAQGPCNLIFINEADTLLLTDDGPAFLTSECNVPRFVCDMNKDDRTDMIFTKPGIDSFFVAAFDTSVDYSVHNMPFFNAINLVPDINGDSIPEFINEVRQEYRYYLAISEPGYQYKQILIDTQVHILDDVIGIGDFMEPGKQEVLVYDHATKSMYLISLRDSEDYPLHTHLFDSVYYSLSSVNDWNADGRPDILINDPTFGYQINDGFGNFAKWNVPLSRLSYGQLLRSEININEHFNRSYYFNRYLDVYTYDQADPSWELASIPEVRLSTGFNIPMNVTLLNGDPYPDYVYRTYNGIALVPGKADKGFGKPQHLITEADLNPYAIEDFNGDQNMDIAYGSKNLRIRFGNGRDTFCCMQTLLSWIGKINGLVAGDFEMDNNPDLVFSIYNPETETSDIYLLRNHSGAFLPAELILDSALVNTNDIFDIDLDGDPDIGIKNNLPGQFLINDGSGNFVVDGFQMETVRRYHDFDGDSIPEIVTHSVWGFDVLKHNGTTYSPWMFFDPQTDYRYYAVLDYNLDGYMDFVAQKNLDPQVDLIKNVNNAKFVTDGTFEQRFGYSFPKLSIYDFMNSFDLDNDKDLDLVYSYHDTIWRLSVVSDKQLIRGNVFWDENLTTIQESEEYGIPEIKVKGIHPGGFITSTFTDDQGYYHLPVDAGHYQLTAESQSSCWEHILEDTLSGYINEFELKEHDFPMILNDDGSKMLANNSHAILRCHRDIIYYVSLVNTGCEMVTGLLTYTLDERLFPFQLTSERAFTISGNQINIQLDTFFPGESVRFQLAFTVPDVSLAGQALHDNLLFNYTLLDGSQTGLTFLQNFEERVLCAHDPNDKIARPDRSIQYAASYVELEDILYTIRFQNTGNDTAFNVLLIDTISPLLNLATLQPVDASHPYKIELDEDSRILRVKFENIFLPDSTVNFVGSNGFFTFLIQPNDNLANYTEVYNSADIYFDFSPAIRTNEVEVIFISDLDLLGTSTSTISNDDIVLAPNPANGVCYVQSLTPFNLVSMMDFGGRKFTLDTSYNTIDISSLPSGIYTLFFSTPGGVVCKKLVKFD